MGCVLHCDDNDGACCFECDFSDECHDFCKFFRNANYDFNKCGYRED